MAVATAQPPAALGTPHPYTAEEEALVAERLRRLGYLD